MSAQHTPGPWYISSPGGTSKLYVGPVVIASHRTALGEGASTPEVLKHISDDELYANARRIVACVNACEGIPNEQLECDQPEFVRIFNERNTLKQQRDDLLKALEAANAALNQHATFPADVELARKVIAGAIARAKAST